MSIKFTDKMIKFFKTHNQYFDETKGEFGRCKTTCPYYEIPATDTCGCRVFDQMEPEKVFDLTKAYYKWLEQKEQNDNN